jgi:hypothetical protein
MNQASGFARISAKCPTHDTVWASALKSWAIEGPPAHWFVNVPLYDGRQSHHINVKQSVVATFEEGTKENTIVLKTDICWLITLDTRSLEDRQELTFDPSMSDGFLSIGQSDK